MLNNIASISDNKKIFKQNIKLLIIYSIIICLINILVLMTELIFVFGFKNKIVVSVILISYILISIAMFIAKVGSPAHFCIKINWFWCICYSTFFTSLVPDAFCFSWYYFYILATTKNIKDDELIKILKKISGYTRNLMWAENDNDFLSFLLKRLLRKFNVNKNTNSLKEYVPLQIIKTPEQFKKELMFPIILTKSILAFLLVILVLVTSIGFLFITNII